MSDNKKSAGNQMWGGRFAAGPGAVMEAINASIDVDRRLWREDIAGSKAHAAMLARRGVISEQDATAIRDGLDAIAAEIEAGDFNFSPALEDIHMNVEARLKELIGEPAGRLHTARSRNDQVATDFRMWTRAACRDAARALDGLCLALAKRAGEHADWIMPGFTHLQTAQPISVGHHLLAYVEMHARDAARFRDAAARMNECPLGSAALAGTAFPIDREMTADALGFDRPCANSLDGVSSRDFALEAMAAGAIAAAHMSRLAEEIVIWASAPYRFVALSDAFSTGSSIMPQKRNPDAAELVRAKAGVILGALTNLTVVMKGLPLAYAKDLQEDKSALFDAMDALSLSLAAMTGMVEDLTFHRERLAQAAGEAYSTATDLADWLVREAGLPFREAHHATGAIVAKAEAAGVALSALPLEEMRAVNAAIDERVYDVLSPEASARSRTSFGGGAPANVARMAAAWKSKLEADLETDA